MRSGSVRNMYMYNNPPSAPWAGHPSNGPIYQNVPQYQGQPRHPMPYQMVQPIPYQGPGWQGPGPSRPRGRGHRRGRGIGHFRGNGHRVDMRNHVEEPMKYVCCKCGEQLQNCEEPGIHLCDGGNQVIINDATLKENDKQEEGEEGKEEELDARLEKLLENLKDFVRSKYKSVTEALEGYVSDKIDEITTLHRENTDEKASLEKLKKELESKANALIKQEKDLKEKQRRLSKDQDAFKREMKKEREEVCRQWQQLRDEITRMEEMHKIQKGRVKLDVGGHVYTTSLLTLTRESDSMLAAMFSGRHELLKEEDGCVFIDRDGTHFRYVLNYLRDGGVNMDCLPRDRQLLRELKKEATYYQLHGLLQQIEKCLY